jgi:hypothetical protein
VGLPFYPILDDRLWLGAAFRDFPFEEKLAALRQRNINVVVCTLKHGYDWDLTGEDWLTYHLMVVPDGKLIPIKQYEAVATRVIAHLHAGDNVLVHCWGGRNRSGLSIALALRRLYGWTGQEALDYVRSRRPQALQNLVFASYLATLPAPPPPRRDAPYSPLRPLRCVSLSGGHAAGKSTLFQWARDRLTDIPGFVWWGETHTSNGEKSICTLPPAQAFDRLCQDWVNPDIHTIVVEGTRIYSTVFRVAEAEAEDRFSRELWTAVLWQTKATGLAHMQARAAAKGREVSTFWETDAAENDLTYRHANAHARLLPHLQSLGVRLGEHLCVEVDPHYRTHAQVQAWLARALRLWQFSRL